MNYVKKFLEDNGLEIWVNDMIEKYICEHCNKEFNNRYECILCESSHEHLTNDKDLTKFPNVLIVGRKDGLRAKYSFESIIKPRIECNINGDTYYEY